MHRTAIDLVLCRSIKKRIIVCGATKLSIQRKRDLPSMYKSRHPPKSEFNVSEGIESQGEND
jgi:hypothetical protein